MTTVAVLSGYPLIGFLLFKLWTLKYKPVYGERTCIGEYSTFQVTDWHVHDSPFLAHRFELKSSVLATFWFMLLLWPVAIVTRSVTELVWLLADAAMWVSGCVLPPTPPKVDIEAQAEVERLLAK